MILILSCMYYVVYSERVLLTFWTFSGAAVIRKLGGAIAPPILALIKNKKSFVKEQRWFITHFVNFLRNYLCLKDYMIVNFLRDINDLRVYIAELFTIPIDASLKINIYVIVIWIIKKYDHLK